ncbi:MAG TPA: hypothetical protein VJR27_00415 [Candidatus Saccharimonadales bacterium]|nr:hypothetical protein [Candidatus Saccharimonadales bacterium]
MALFRKNVDAEGKSTDFYENQVLNPKIGDHNVGTAFAEVVKQQISEADEQFSKVSVKDLSGEITVLRFELFALAWTHKYVSGDMVVSQSSFTKQFLEQKGRHDIWKDMTEYNNMIDSVTLNWLSGLGKTNLSFNYGMREDLSKKNIESAQKLGVADDDVIARVNNRLWSENAWKQKLMLEPLAYMFCDSLGIELQSLNGEAQFGIAATIKGLYDGARQFI